MSCCIVAKTLDRDDSHGANEKKSPQRRLVKLFARNPIPAQIPENIPFQAKQEQNRISFHSERWDPDRVHQLMDTQLL